MITSVNTFLPDSHKDEDKSKEELINELVFLRKRNDELEKRELEYKAKEENLYKIVENIPLMMAGFDDKGNIIFWNKECKRVTGYTSEEIINNPHTLKLLFINDENFNAIMQKWKEIGNNFKNWDINFTCKDGSEKVISWFNISESVSIFGWNSWAIGKDITSRKQMEDALQDSEEKFRNLSEEITDGVSVTIDGKNYWVNNGFARIFGYSKEELIGKGPELIVVPEQIPLLMERMNHRLNNKKVPSHYELKAKHKDGRVLYVDVLAKKIKFDNREAIQIVIRDITERKELERQILNISEKERIRIGHDLHDSIGQYFTGIGYLTRVLLGKLTDKQDSDSSIALEILNLINDAKSQTRMLAKGLCPVYMDESGIIMAIKELCQNTEKIFNISCSFIYDSDILIKDNSTATHVYYIVQESINNAVKHGNAKNILVYMGKSNDGIVISVEDDGSGFEENYNKDKGIGLNLMKYRSDIIGAVLHFEASETGGVIVTCMLGGDKMGEMKR